jgi:hypothetical protein
MGVILGSLRDYNTRLPTRLNWTVYTAECPRSSFEVDEIEDAGQGSEKRAPHVSAAKHEVREHADRQESSATSVRFDFPDKGAHLHHVRIPEDEANTTAARSAIGAQDFPGHPHGCRVNREPGVRQIGKWGGSAQS